jgi:endogenous inhibitor of DNA gyrase (YacG/DUF329 family)
MLVNRVHKPFHCRICGSTSQIKVCKCQKAYYCSKNCQKIDWKKHKSECYDVVKYQGSLNPNSLNNHEQNVKNIQDIHILESNILNSACDTSQQKSYNCDREGQSYSHNSHIETSFNTIAPNIETPTCSETNNLEENLFNSLLFSVDEGTEREILKNLEIGEEDLLNVIATENTLNFDEQSEVVVENDQIIDEETFEKIQRKKSCEYQPEAQKLLKETRENLEKELSMFREIHLSENINSQNQVEINSADVNRIMQFKSNPKYQADARIDDHLIRYRILFFSINKFPLCLLCQKKIINNLHIL